MGRPTSYEEALAQHRWEVPERYNIAADVCDKHPADKLAMIHEDFRGSVREVTWGELQAASNRFAHVLRAHGIEKGDRVAMLLPPTPETAAAFFATFKCGAILLSMSVLYGDEGIRHRVSDSGAKVLVTDRANADRVDPGLVQDVLLIEDFPSEGDDRFEAEDTLAEDPAQLYYSSGTTGLAKGILHAHRYLLAHEEFVYCHDVQDGELFHGMGEWAWAAGIAPLFGPVAVRRRPARLPARGRVRSAQAARRALAPRRDERLHDADGDALDDGDHRRRDPLSAAVPRRVQRGRAAQPGGDPLVPRAVRADGARLLRAHGVVSARGQLPVHGRPRGLDGAADAGLGGRDPRRGRAAGPAGRARRDLPARADRTRTTRSATGTTRRRAPRRSAATGSTRRTPPASTPTATSGTRAARTT